MQKIRHIKIALPLLAVALIAGFFVWHLMWMNEISEKNDKMILSGEVSDIAKPKKIMKRQYKSNHDKTDSHKSDSILNPDKNKISSTIIKGRTLAISLKNRQPEEPVEKLDGADISTTQHPTSTTPY